MVAERRYPVTVTMPAALVRRLDELADEMREARPGVVVSRSQIVAHLVAEHLNLIQGQDDPVRYIRHRDRRLPTTAELDRS